MYNVAIYSVIAQTQNLKMPKYPSHLSSTFTDAIYHSIQSAEDQEEQIFKAEQMEVHACWLIKHPVWCAPGFHPALLLPDSKLRILSVLLLLLGNYFKLLSHAQHHRFHLVLECFSGYSDILLLFHRLTYPAWHGWDFILKILFQHGRSLIFFLIF